MFMTNAHMIYGPIAPINNFGANPANAFNGSLTSAALSTDWSSWGTLVSSVPHDLAGFEIADASGLFGQTPTNSLMEVRYTLGGNSQTIVEQMPMGGVQASRSFIFPIFVPHGASIEWRIKTNRASVSGYYISFVGLPGPSNNGYIRSFLGCRCYGIDAANNRGTAATAGNGAYGTAVSLGATDLDLNAARLLPHFGGSSITVGGNIWARVLRGVSGSELFKLGCVTQTTPGIVNLTNNTVMPMFLPSGTPLAVQVRSASGSNTAIHYVVQGFYGAL